MLADNEVVNMLKYVTQELKDWVHQEHGVMEKESMKVVRASEDLLKHLEDTKEFLNNKILLETLQSKWEKVKPQVMIGTTEEELSLQDFENDLYNGYYVTNGG